MKYVFIIAFAFMSISAHTQSPCSDPKVHEFDFWIGKWIVYKTGTDTIAGYNEIKAVAGGCSLLESYRNASGTFTGNSLNKYDFAKGKWQQFWVDNSGATLFIEGSYSGKKMIMENEETSADGRTKTKNRITWFKKDDRTVRQLWEQSTDGGKTWSVAFDGIYKKELL